MMSTVLRPALLGIALGGSLLLAACDGVGKGITPESSVLLPSGGKEGDATMKAYTCLNRSLTLIVDFSNGARGDFTSRAKWKSSKPDVVDVSNGEIPVPDQDGFFYARGVLVMRKAGSAVITSEYLDFQNSITVTVTNPSNFTITPATANLAVGSNLDLALTADLEGESTNIDGFATWAFVENSATTDPIATIVPASGTIVSPATGASTSIALTARAKIPGCTLAAAQTLDAPVNVSPLDSLALSKEFASNQLVLNTTEPLTVVGTLVNGATQDMTGQATFVAVDTTSPPATIAPVSFPFGGLLRNYAFANTASPNPVKLTATFGADAAKRTSNEIEVTPITATLTSLTVSAPADVLAPGKSLQFKATGDYGGGLSQDVTRHVVWASDTTDTVVIQTSGGSAVNFFAGLAVAGSAAEVGKAIKITASTVTPAVSADKTITIAAPAP